MTSPDQGPQGSRPRPDDWQPAAPPDASIGSGAPPEPDPIRGYGNEPEPAGSWRPRRQLSTGASLGILAGVVVLIVVAVFVLPSIRGSGAGTSPNNGARTVFDPGQQVSIVLPGGWTDETSASAGTEQTGKDGESGLVPDIEASSTFGESQLAVYVLREHLTSGAQSHLDIADEFCRTLGCIDRGRTRTVEINGHQAYQQTLTHPADAGSSTQTLLTTIRTPDLLTVLRGEYDADGTNARTELEAVVATVQIQD